MRNRLWSGSWCSVWRACYGGYDGERPSRRVFSKSRRTISATSERPTKSPPPRVRSFMRFSMQTQTGKPCRTVSRTQPRRARHQDRLQFKPRLLLMLSSHVVSCGSPICLISLSTASVAMKRLFGVKPGRFCLRSTIWTAVSRKRECHVSILAVSKHKCSPWPSSADPMNPGPAQHCAGNDCLSVNPQSALSHPPNQSLSMPPDAAGTSANAGAGGSCRTRGRRSPIACPQLNGCTFDHLVPRKR